jgi:hypothetical protein
MLRAESNAKLEYLQHLAASAESAILPATRWLGLGAVNFDAGWTGSRSTIDGVRIMIKALSKTVLGVVLATLTAATVAATNGDSLQVADNAPDNYVVKKGDTLWAISGMFLKQPWRWPEVWKLNQQQIHNPHLIYPGQVIVLDRNGPTLSIGRSVTNGNDRLSPRVYETDAASPIASISMEAIRPFLIEPLVTEQPDSPTLPTVVAIQEDRVIAGVNDSIYAKNLRDDNSVSSWHVYRPGKPIRNPYNDKDILGYEAEYVATAKVAIPEANGKVAELHITDSKLAVNTTDRLQPAGKSELMAIPPHVPSNHIEAGVAAVYGGVSTAGKNSVVSISAGRTSGVEPGHVFAVMRANADSIYSGDGKKEVISKPDTRNGLLYVFRVFNRISYALVVEAGGPVYVGDKVTNP